MKTNKAGRNEGGIQSGRQTVTASAGGRSPAARTRALLLAAIVPMLMAGKCEGPLVEDSGFDIWCGATLCKWQVESGEIRPAPTWHSQDLGVELVGPEVALSQTLAVDQREAPCLHFSVLADVEDPVTVTLAVSYDGVPAPEQTQRLTTGTWTPIKYRLPTATYFHSLGLTLHKTGSGRAVLAQLQAASSSDCPATPPPGPTARPAGATCESSLQCSAGTTCRPRGPLERADPDPSLPASSVCAACTADDECAVGQVCGLASAAGIDEPFAACVPAAGAALGERCRGDLECASGICCNGACSTCCPSAPLPTTCAAGQTCAEGARDALGQPARVAWQCANSCTASGVAGGKCE